MDLAMIQFFSQYGALGLFAWIMFKRQTAQNDRMSNEQSKQNQALMNLFMESMKETAKELKNIANNVGRTQLTESQTIDLFKATLNEHIDRKTVYAMELLLINNIHNREAQIKRDLKSKFVQITREEAEKLSAYVTPAGDLGAILCSIDFEEFMAKVYEIFFKDKTDNDLNITEKEFAFLKTKDLKAMMREYVNSLTEQVYTKMADNRQ